MPSPEGRALGGVRCWPPPSCLSQHHSPPAAEQGTANPSKWHQEIPSRRITHPTGELQSKTIDRELHKSLDTRELTGFSYFNTKLLFPVTRLRQTRNGTHRKSWAIACYQELLKPKWSQMETVLPWVRSLPLFAWISSGEMIWNANSNGRSRYAPLLGKNAETPSQGLGVG